MKKLLNISVIAALAILPVAANADITTTDPGATNANAPVAENAPKYSLATADDTDANLATAGYVKGAYNATIKAINKVATTAANAADQDLSNLSNTGKANVAAQGTYDTSTNYTAGTVGAAIKSKADAATTYTKTEVDTALGAKADAATTYTKTEVDTALGAKADAATTLSGYGITDAYTKTEVDNAVAGSANTATYSNSTTYDTGTVGAAIKSLETTAGNAANQDLSNLSNTGKANVAAQGTYDASTNYTAGTVGAAIKSKADAATTLSGYGITDAYTKTEVDTALGDYATKTGVLATINASTVPVMATWGSTNATTVSVDAPNSFVNQ